MLHPTSSRYISPGRVVFAHALPTSSAAISERSQASPGRAHISPGRTSSPGRVIFSDTLPARSARTQHEDDGLPRLAHRMGARRMRRFFNDKFMDSPVTMAAVEEDDACLQSTQLPFYQRGCHFSSEAAWLVDFNDDHTTPPRRRPPPPSPRRTSTTANSSSKREGSSKRHATTSASAAAAGREERGRSMFYRLDASERALLRTHVTVTRRHALWSCRRFSTQKATTPQRQLAASRRVRLPRRRRAGTRLPAPDYSLLLPARDAVARAGCGRQC